MSSLLRRIGLVVGFGCVALIGGRLWQSRDAGRYAAAQRVVDDACRAYRAVPRHANANVCRFDDFGPKAIPLVKKTDRALASAKLLIARGDTREADRVLASVLADADNADHLGTMIGNVVAANLVERVLDLVDANPALDRNGLRALDLEAFRHPIAADALHRRWLLAHWREWADSPHMSNAALATAIESDASTYEAMERAILAGDRQTCEAAAKRVSLEQGLRGKTYSEVVMCGQSERLVRVQRRLDALRAGLPFPSAQPSR